MEEREGNCWDVDESGRKEKDFRVERLREDKAGNN